MEQRELIEKENQLKKEFMLKEYESYYKLFDIHYKAIELTFNLFLIIISAFIGVLSFVYKDSISQLNIFELDDLSLAFIFIGATAGLFLYFKLVEHRILIITYVRSLNLIRKWFADSSNGDLDEYLFYPAKGDNPPYYIKYGHFYWEALSFASITSSLFGILLLNAFSKLNTSVCQGIKYLIFILLIIIFDYIQIYYYRHKANKKERE